MGEFCVELRHGAHDPSQPNDHVSRYRIVDLFNGYAPGPLRAHLYDLGPSGGYALAGLERPEDGTPPR